MLREERAFPDLIKQLVAERILAGSPYELDSAGLARLHQEAVAVVLDLAVNALARAQGLSLPTEESARRSDGLADDAGRRLLQEATGAIRSGASAGLLAAELGSCLEELSGLRPQIGTHRQVTFRTAPERRDNGVYFTPVPLAEGLARSVLVPALEGVNEPDQLAGLRVLDPAVGCGSFLLATVRLAAEMLRGRAGFKSISPSSLRRLIAAHSVYGVDVDPTAVGITKALLWLEVGDADWDPSELDGHMRVADSIGASLADWRAWFPDVPAQELGNTGFSVVLTNPPWGKLRPLRKEYFTHLDERVGLYQGTSLEQYVESNLSQLAGSTWQQYAERTIATAAQLRANSDYRLNAGGHTGDPDLYKYFVERCLQLLGSGGYAGLLLPSGVLRASGSSGLREMLLEQGRVERLVEFWNKRRIFPIHGMYRFCVVAYRKGARGGVRAAQFRQLDPRVFEHPAPGRSGLSLGYLRLTGGPLRMIPEVSGQRQRDLLGRIYASHPVLGDEAGGWNVAFKRELDMTNDSGAFVSRAEATRRGFGLSDDGTWRRPNDDEVLLSVYEGRMVNQFNSQAKTHISGQGRSAVWAVTLPGGNRGVPNFLVAKGYASRRGWEASARAGYCEISGHANERTVLSALIPGSAVCGNKVPTLAFAQNDLDTHLLWLTLANSLIVDWTMRRWVSTTLNYFYWHNIPFPFPARLSTLRAQLVGIARELSLSEAPTMPEALDSWLGRRALMRAYVDIVVAGLYGLTCDDLALALDDFPLLEKRWPSCAGASLVSTRELILMAASSDQMDAFDADKFGERIGVCAEAASRAYLPSELARTL